MVYKNVTNLVGKTPLMKLDAFKKEIGAKCEIYGKLECFNPAGSAKDRVALNMLLSAKKAGLLKKGTVIIEPTSGNTGIGLASMGTRLGYRVILTMPASMSKERVLTLKAYGAKVVLTKAKYGMQGAVDKANEIAAEYPDTFIPSQFTNEENPNAHYKTTGPEIWKDLRGKIDVFVATIGTGGTLMGVGKYLKEQNPDIKLIGVEPYSSPLLTLGFAGTHKIQGIGANFVPEIFDKNFPDEILMVKDEDAFECARMFAGTEGITVGISSGAALDAVRQLAEREEFKGKKIVALLPDTGDRYMSSKLFI